VKNQNSNIYIRKFVSYLQYTGVDMNTVSSPEPKAIPAQNMRRKAGIDFGLFAVFFAFYLGAALIQTPLFKNVATMQVLHMPFGLMMSLLIFPVSWVLIIIWFWKAR
jgi:uncharacterized membrane protein (DUF485 family)